MKLPFLSTRNVWQMAKQSYVRFFCKYIRNVLLRYLLTVDLYCATHQLFVLLQTSILLQLSLARIL